MPAMLVEMCCVAEVGDREQAFSLTRAAMSCAVLYLVDPDNIPTMSGDACGQLLSAHSNV